MSESASYISFGKCKAIARVISSPRWGLFNNTFPFTVSLPLPLPFLRCFPIPLPCPLPILSHLPFPLAILCTVPFPGPFLTFLCVLLTLAVGIVIAIGWTAPLTIQCAVMRPVLIIIVLVDYLILALWSNGCEVARLVLPAAWQLKLGPKIIATIPREALTSLFNLPRTSCQRNGPNDLIPECTRVVTPPIVNLVASLVKPLPHICAEGGPPLPTMRTPTAGLRPHNLELCKVASRDWIKKHYIIEEVPRPPVLHVATIGYRDESTNSSQNYSLCIVPTQRQGSIYNWCRHFCPSSCLPLSTVAALRCHRGELKMNVHPRRYHYDTVASGRWMHTGNGQSCVGYQVCFGTRGFLWCKSRDVEIVQNAGGVFTTWRNENGGVGGKKGCIYSSWCDFLVQLESYDNFDSYLAFCWLTNTKHPSLYLAQPPGTLCMTSLKTRFSTRGEGCLWCQALLVHHTPLLPLRTHPSRSKLTSSQVLPNVQPSNTASNTPSVGKRTNHWYHRIENTSLFALRCFELCQSRISTGNLKIYKIDGSKHSAKIKCNTMISVPRRHKHTSSGANRPSHVAVTVNINALDNLSSIWWQLTLWLKACQGVTSPRIVAVWSVAQSTLCLPFWSNPSLGTQIGVYFASLCICMHRKWFLHS